MAGRLPVSCGQWHSSIAQDAQAPVAVKRRGAGRSCPGIEMQRPRCRAESGSWNFAPSILLVREPGHGSGRHQRQAKWLWLRGLRQRSSSNQSQKHSDISRHLGPPVGLPAEAGRSQLVNRKRRTRNDTEAKFIEALSVLQPIPASNPGCSDPKRLAARIGSKTLAIVICLMLITLRDIHGAPAVTGVLVGLTRSVRR
jgi:hypothetical protein